MMKHGGGHPIRIAHIMGKMNGGGVESVVMNYYRHIDRLKIQFDFIVDRDSTHIPREEIEKLGGKVILVPSYTKVFAYQKSLMKIFRDGKYRIVHSHLNTLSIFPLRVARRAGIPVRIAHSHSTAGKGELGRNILKYVLRPFSKVYATHYFACSKYAGEWLFGKKVANSDKLYIMHNAIDLDRFKSSQKKRDAKRKELGISKDQFVVGHIGRFVKPKNHSFLIDIFAEVAKERPDSVLLLVGDGPLKNKIEQRVGSLGLDDVVKFLGLRPNDIPELYMAMDIFAFPSLYEGLGIAAIEAQTAGLPCLISDKVPNEAIITKEVRQLPLNKEIWYSNLLIAQSKDAKPNISDHDIITAAKILSNGYLNRIEMG
jgi:glycosyltransferase EpsF